MQYIHLAGEEFPSNGELCLNRLCQPTRQAHFSESALAAHGTHLEFGRSDKGAETYLTIQEIAEAVATNIPLPCQLCQRTGFWNFRLAGGPGWVNMERYDIVGLARGATKSDDITPACKPGLQTGSSSRRFANYAKDG